MLWLRLMQLCPPPALELSLGGAINPPDFKRTGHIVRTRYTAVLAALAGACLAAPAAQGSQFDGRWNVVLTTTAGDCEKAIPGSFAVKGLDIAHDGKSSLFGAGAIEKNGSMWSRFVHPENRSDIYRMQGRFRGATASGAWSNGLRYCGGTWRATRVR